MKIFHIKLHDSKEFQLDYIHVGGIKLHIHKNYGIRHCGKILAALTPIDTLERLKGTPKIFPRAVISTKKSHDPL